MVKRRQQMEQEQERHPGCSKRKYGRITGVDFTDFIEFPNACLIRIVCSSF